MRHTRIAGAVAVSAILVVTAGCGSSGSSKAAGATGSSWGSCKVTGTAGSIPLKTTTSGTLTIKADLPSAGWWDGDTIGSIKSGYEYCLASEIAYLGGQKQISLQNVSFDKLVSGTLTGYDLSLDEISITPARAKVVTFSKPYYDSYLGVLTKKGSKVTGANLRKMTIGVKEGTAAQTWVSQTLKPSGSVKVFPGDTEALAAVAAGQVDAYIQDVAIELGQAKKSSGAVSVIGKYNSGQSYGIMFPKGSENVTAVNKILAWCKKHGYLNQLSKTYLGPAFGGDPASVPAWSVS
ncbi:ABC transporter substrate-binding protein [Leekyejoonella antrihumi]|uniref:Amino acid ABC transporter substrate-binding protein n=1 Tax=Leekyejoonella antrihumi TaxID=1660198 RepID=A0A563E8H5_9MICO|nr:ABC transporter substrate-binding protein [Leekyejoonella antrihumi]TWP38512.1 amino acid ABC transporter substrate-binding protein [Leekyejoonella antrihumi]